MSNLNIFSVTLQNIVIVFCAFLCGFYFTGLFHEPTSFVGGLWAVISGIIVLESTARDSLRSAKARIIGTLIGSIISGIYLYLFEFSILGYGICVGVGILICHILKLKQAVKLTAITISVILIVTTIEKELHPMINAGLRFAESAIGTAIALLVAYIVHYLNKYISKTT